MATETNLVRMNLQAYANTRKTFTEIETKISSCQDLDKTIYRLALLTLISLVVSLAKASWEWFAKGELKPGAMSTSSMVFAIYILCIGLATLGCWIARRIKTKRIEEKIESLAMLTRKKFYGETPEFSEDKETSKEVLAFIQNILRPHVGKEIDTKYHLVATNKIELTGDLSESFSWSSTRLEDNMNEVQSIRNWRQFFSELYHTQPQPPLIILKVVASQCVQDLPTITLDEDGSIYTCSSPTIQNPKDGFIAHQHKVGGKPPTTYRSLEDFRKYIDEIPKVTLTPLQPSMESPRPVSSGDTMPDRRGSGSIVVNEDYLKKDPPPDKKTPQPKVEKTGTEQTRRCTVQ